MSWGHADGGDTTGGDKSATGKPPERQTESDVNKEYQDWASHNTTIPDKNSFGTFTPGLNPGDSVKAPPVPGGGETPGKGVTTVNTKAMKNLAQHLDELLPPLKSTQERIAGVKLRPGGFQTAVNLSKSVDNIKDATGATLRSVVEVVAETSDALKRIALKYESAEEANKMTGDDFGKYFSQTSGWVNAMGGGSGAKS
ncbi:hypothetical protein [Amycolatopsis sp. NPDC059021]|uniref:hypothetical protein n=1 Tax=Amycolatopsis sp. NPDC059021 TaxID=3346704 RepID=UPI00366C361B